MHITLTIIISYLLGSIPFALIVGKFFFNTDVREYGSGNLGSTNTFRTLGKKAGIIVLLGDVSKGFITVCLPHLLSSNVHPLICGLIAIIGHSYPIFAKFKGGKSVATTAGVLLGFAPITCTVGIITFLITLKLSKYVSLSSTIAGFFVFISSLFLLDPYLIAFTTSVFVFLTFKHRKNFSRIKSGNEPKVGWI